VPRVAGDVEDPPEAGVVGALELDLAELGAVDADPAQARPARLVDEHVERAAVGRPDGAQMGAELYERAADSRRPRPLLDSTR
jgi:hypothetical protein